MNETYLPFLLFYFFFTSFRRLISEITEQILTILGRIFTYDCYLKNLVRTPQAHTPTEPLFGTAFEL